LFGYVYFDDFGYVLFMFTYVDVCLPFFGTGSGTGSATATATSLLAQHQRFLSIFKSYVCQLSKAMFVNVQSYCRFPEAIFVGV
jgi:hypothetical protein